MPKFRVFKGHDAYVNYEAIIEAENLEEANDFISWKSNQHVIDWKRNGDVNEYDHFETFEDRTEELVPGDDETVEEFKSIEVTDAEHATILAALRFYLAKGLGDPVFRTDAIHNIATNGDQVISLDAEAIDQLCKRINR